MIREAPVRPFVIGVIGGVAAGKSHFGLAMEKVGAARIDADKIGHDVLVEADIVEQLSSLFGRQVLDGGGAIDRSAVANIVFANNPEGQRALKLLESIVHPRIRARLIEQLEDMRQQELPPIAVVIDAPLLLETGLESLCDVIVFIDASRETRLNRALLRGWSEKQFDEREASQLSIEDKKERATHVVAGDLSADRLRRFCENLLS